MVTKASVYLSDSFDVYENLAIEKYLFDRVSADEYILYLWQNESTVVIGRNQNPDMEFDRTLARQEGVKIARRSSGGGAVFHDLGNLNFTFIASRENYSLDKNIEVIQSACAAVGIETALGGRNDIYAAGRKFSGNAFFSSAEKAYHHGTLLVSADIGRMQKILTPPSAKLESKGVKSVSARVINLCELCPTLSCARLREGMIAAFSRVWGIRAEFLPPADIAEIAPLAAEYASDNYIDANAFPCTYQNEGQFAEGQIALRLEIVHGEIKEAAVFTDSMNWERAEQIRACLVGAAFTGEAVEERLRGLGDSRIAGDILRLLF